MQIFVPRRRLVVSTKMLNSDEVQSLVDKVRRNAQTVISMQTFQEKWHGHHIPLHALRQQSPGWLRVMLSRMGWDKASDEDLENMRLARLAAQYLLPSHCRIHPSTTTHIVVVGCGKLGLHIAGEMLRRGCYVDLCDETQIVTSGRRAKLAETIRVLCSQKFLLTGDVDSLLARCFVATSVEQAIKRAGHASETDFLVIIEATPDVLASKQCILSMAAAACRTEDINPTRLLIGTTSLTLSVHQLTSRMDSRYARRVIGMRFMQPVWFIDQVEVSVEQPGNAVGAEATTVADTRHFLTELHMKPQLVTVTDESSCRRLTTEETILYMVRQRVQCECDEQRSISVGSESSAFIPPVVVSGYVPQNLRQPYVTIHPPLVRPECFMQNTEAEIAKATVGEILELLVNDESSEQIATDIGLIPTLCGVNDEGGPSIT